MPSVYPAALDTLATNKADATVSATDHPAHHNDLADAVNKIEAELGTDPSGPSVDVKTRLALLATLADPTFTGDPKAPTPAQGDNDTSIATSAYVQTELGFYIPKSLVDAKGDLLVGSADNTVVRKAVSGVDGRVLTEDAASSGGIKWATPVAQPMAAGSLYTGMVGDVFAGALWVNGLCTFQPIWIGRSCTLITIACQVNGGGTAGAVVRLGIYNDNAGVPGTLLLDAGTVGATTSGVKQITISQAITPGVYWLAGASQGSPGTQPNMICAANKVIPYVASDATALYRASGYGVNSITGAFASSPTVTVQTNVMVLAVGA